MTKPNGWEQDIKEDLYAIGAKQIDFMMNNRGVRIINKIHQAILSAEENLLREIMEEMPKKKEDSKHSGDEIDDMWCVTCSEGIETHPMEIYGFNDYHDQVNTILERKLSTVKRK